MLVKNVLSELANPTRWKQMLPASPSSADEATKSEGTPASSTSSLQPSTALREILSQYDVRDISPRTFSEMLQRLHRAGVLADAEYQDLSLVRMDLEREGIGPDEQTDLLAFFQRRLRELPPESSAEQSTTQRRLDWLLKVSLMQSPEQLPVVDQVV